MEDKQSEPQGTLVIQTVAMPADTNANGDIFGGWLVSHMDMGAGFAGRRRAHSRVVTVAIDSLVFIRPVTVGDTVCCYANLVKVGRTSMQFKMEAWTLALQDEKPKKAAEGMFTFVAIDENGHPRPVDR
ncbi:putative acyl-CoA thioester hydrolase [Aquicella siphonis]|uniref:Putative acyl-CoA thioester hydrolase n=1 Tax=Aquicella siphonis TaxID=254247 RepID=A0A5E4PHM0_9COXI|nr:acyl-CoA thioesterase [Aquicella siphonis]VVC75811.1 putative acyl-CoA thioester hydrolase [Aquicella siphonis]